MKQFNMKEINMSPAESELHGTHEMGRDEAGRLYSVRMRELMKPLGVDTTAVEALAALRIAGKSLRMMQERWAETYDLSEGRLGVMFRLFRVGDCQLGDLADELDSTPRNITGLVDHLERDGLVERVPDPQDRSEEHTSELQSQSNIVCRLLLEKKKPSPPQPQDHCTSALS